MKMLRLTLRLTPNGRDMRIAVVAGVIPALALSVGLQVGPAKIASAGLRFAALMAMGLRFAGATSYGITGVPG